MNNSFVSFLLLSSSSVQLSMIWFYLFFAFLVLEMGHPGLFYFLSFSFGSAAAFISAWFELSDLWQITIFLVGTCLSLLVMHYVMKSQRDQLAAPSHRSNLDALIGKKVYVFQSSHDINMWQTKIAGQIWLVREMHDRPLVEGQQVIIVEVQGCHLRVESIK